jgi:DNA replication protein DnaC
MKTTTEPTAPPLAYAFTQFARTRPILKEIAGSIYESWDKCYSRCTKPPWFLQWVESDLKRASAHFPRPPFPQSEIDALKQKAMDASLPMEERQSFHAEMTRLQQEYKTRVHDEIAKKISDLKSAAESEIQAFEKWIAEDPEGIAAAAQDTAHFDFVEAQRLEQEAQRKQALEAETERREAKREKVGLEELEDAIGYKLLELDTDHPDVDGSAIRQFLDWFPLDWKDLDKTNGYLVGPPRLGKTRALAAAAIIAAKEFGFESVTWITGHEFAELVSDLGSNDRRESANLRIKELAESWLLFFDDLGGAGFTPQRTSRFFALIDTRYRLGRATYLTSNYSPSALKKIFSSTSEGREEGIRILGRILGTPNQPLAKIFSFKRAGKIDQHHEKN